MENLTVWQQMMVLFGQLCLFVCVGAALICGAGWVKEEIGYLKRRRQYKHRFKGKPTAKCYCVGCEHWAVCSTDGSTGACMNGIYNGYRTADSFFCKYAEPRSKEEDKRDIERKRDIKQYETMEP